MKHLDENTAGKSMMVVFFFFFFLLLFIQEKCLFAKNVIRKVMGVIAVQFQFWFQFDRHNKTQTCRPPPSTFHLQPLSCCADWAVGGGGAVRHRARDLQSRQPGGLMVLTV